MYKMICKNKPKDSLGIASQHPHQSYHCVSLKYTSTYQHHQMHVLGDFRPIASLHQECPL